MADNQCPECDRLWHELGEIAHRNFHLEERIRTASTRQDNELAMALGEKLADLVQEQSRIYKVLTQHEATDHNIPKEGGHIPTLGE